LNEGGAEPDVVGGITDIYPTLLPQPAWGQFSASP